MSLATRCTSCGTTFRVVQDQLRVSDGWVRCGRCDTVFDALAALVDLDAAAIEDAATAPRPQQQRAAPAVDATINIQRLLERQDDASASMERELDDVKPSAGALADNPPPIDPEPAAGPGAAADGADAAAALAAPAEPPAATPAPAIVSPAVASANTAAGATAPAAPPLVRPTFVQRADRQAHWNSPAMRAALLGSSLILLLMLALQVIHHQRDSLAAHSPTAAAVLRSACARWNCSIEPLRRIADITIESSALVKIAGQAQAVKLTLSLRNRGAIELAMPAIELSLTDGDGKLIARRDLLPADFRVDPPVIDAGSVLPLQLVVSTPQHRIAGYTVELFYP